MEYIANPIDVLLFDKHFRIARGAMLEGTTLVAFTQTEKRWKATYQDGEVSVRFTGTVAWTRDWLHTEDAEKEETP